jgi:hypothetical protein
MRDTVLNKLIPECVLVVAILAVTIPNVAGHACDCNAGGQENRVCLYTDPQNVQLDGYTFDFDIKIRNYYRGGTLRNVQTSVQSCSKQGGGSCTTNGGDFSVSINPSNIASTAAGDGPTSVPSGLDPDECRDYGYGTIETVNVRITIKDAADGTYNIRFRVSWSTGLSRYIDVTISFESACVDECTAGQRECVGSTQYRVCDTSGACNKWGSTQNCPSGQTCSNGQCVSSCSDECSPSGSKRCSGNNVQTCGNYDFDSCLEWGGDVACGSGLVCSGGVCVSACSNECSPSGSRRCSGNNVQTCGNYDSDSCLEWGGDSACSAGRACSNGQCVLTCSNECSPSGSRRCNGDMVQTCMDYDSDGCFEWGGDTSCGAGRTCSGGLCVTSCYNECTASGLKRCSGDVAQTCGNYDSDSCLEWGGNIDCSAEGKSCSWGECVGGTVQCSDDCVSGSKRCSGIYVQTCGDYDSDSCLEWGGDTACGSGLVCSGGVCVSSCTNECTASGSKRCSGNIAQTCGDYDSDSCLEWGNNVDCADQGMSCSWGECVSTCDDTCSPSGAKRCSGNIAQTCGDYDSDSCVEWGGDIDCASQGKSCSWGACVVSCSDECTPSGSKRCSGSIAQKCGNYDSDSCLEWGENVYCSQEGKSCSWGECVSTCTDECTPSGKKTCTGNIARTCGDHDSDSCLEWGDDVDCASQGLSCSWGECVSTCSDECTPSGTKRCNGNIAQTCGNHDSDSCLEWGGDVNCLTAGQSCSNGQCVSGCSNECSPSGSKRCEGNNVEACGDYDSDSCLEWGDSSYCGTGRICCNSACMTPTCVTGNDCDDGSGCTVDSCVGAATCDAGCQHQQITSCANSDGCCPSGCSAANDNDCSTGCGNGICEITESCESCSQDCACGPGQMCCSGQCKAPACSSDSECGDANSCTLDSCVGAGTCDARCEHGQVTSCLNDDGCCPGSCNALNDNDCSVQCGNGLCEPGESCQSCSRDCGCSGGTLCCNGVCVEPACVSDSQCDDSKDCTLDRCLNSNTCLARCETQAITQCANGDGCCPDSCDANNDNDCVAKCGNGLCEPGESCESCQQDCGCSSGTVCRSGLCVEPACSSDTDCDDEDACTLDGCIMPGTCEAECAYEQRSSCANNDGCCPAGCTSSDDDDCSASCGNGVCESSENCLRCRQDCGCMGGQLCCSGLCVEPRCSSDYDCGDGKSCTVDWCLNPGSCVAECDNREIAVCMHNDGCCASGCSSATDSDCSSSCGNRLCEAGESCTSCEQDCGCGSGLCCGGMCVEPLCVADYECDDGSACTIDSCSGAGGCSAQCQYTRIVACLNNDGCCPVGCNEVSDNDCSSSCGNGICEFTESCSTCAADCGCSPDQVCCNGLCSYPECSTTADCADSSACTLDSCLNPATCIAECSHRELIACTAGDDCCPAGCNALYDNDCEAVCGNSLCEPGEDCSSCSSDCLLLYEICCEGSAFRGDCCSDDGCDDRFYCDFHVCVPMPAQCGDGLCEEEKGESCLTCNEDCLGSGETCCGGVAFTGNCCTDSDCGTHMMNYTCLETRGCANHTCRYEEFEPSTKADCCSLSYSVATDNCSETCFFNDTVCGAGRYCGQNCTCEINNCTMLARGECSGVCAWCPLDGSCKPAASVECTYRQCLNSSSICTESCRVADCAGTAGSCFCTGGSCVACVAGQDCSEGICVAPVVNVTDGIGGSSCEPEWVCSNWSPCYRSNQRMRTCTDEARCGTDLGRPEQSKSCDFLAEQRKEGGVSEQVSGESRQEGVADRELVSDETVETEKVSGVTGYGTVIIVLLALGLVGAYLYYNKSAGLHLLTGEKKPPVVEKPAGPKKPRHSTLPMVKAGERWVPLPSKERPRPQQRRQTRMPARARRRPAPATGRIWRTPPAIDGLKKTLDKNLRRLQLLKERDKRIVKRRRKTGR